MESEFTGVAELVIDTGAFQGEVADLAFSPDGTLLAAAGGKVVRVWRLEPDGLELIATLRGDFDRTSYGNCYAVEFTPDGKRLLVGVDDSEPHGNIRVYRLDQLDEIERLLPGHRSACRRISFARDGRFMATQDRDGRILLWDARTFQVLQTVAPPDAKQPDRVMFQFPTNAPVLVEMDANGPQLVAVPSGRRLGGADLNSLPPELVEWLKRLFQNGYDAYAPLAASKAWDFRLDQNRWLASGTSKERGKRFWVSLWTSATQRTPQTTYTGHVWEVRCAAIHPNGKLVASADAFGEIHVWDARTGQETRKITPLGQPVYEVAFDRPQGDRSIERLIFGTKVDASRWGRNSYGPGHRVLKLTERAFADVQNVDGVRALAEQPSQHGISMNFERRGERFDLQKIRNGRTESVYKLRSGALLTAYTVLDGPAAGVQEPIIFGDNGGLLALWDSATSQLSRAFLGHGAMVTSLSVSPDRKLLVSSSTDRTIRIWSLQDPNPTGLFDFEFENSSVTEVRPNTSSARAGVQVGDQIVSIAGRSMREMYSQMLRGEFNHRPGDRVPAVLSRNGREFRYEMTLEPGYEFVDPLLNLFLGENGEWIIWNPQGYYDASPGADRWIGWHVNRGPEKSARFFEVHQFRKQLYRPDIIDGIIRLGNIDQAIAAANSQRPRGSERHDFRNPREIAQHQPPRVEILGPADGFRTNDPRVDLAFRVRSTNGLPITKVSILHNETTVKIIQPSSENAQELEIADHRLRLQSGRNVVRVVAHHAQAYSSEEISLVAEVAATKTNVHALAIGISDYQSKNLRALKFADDDAREFLDSLKSHEQGKLYDSIAAKLVTNEQATREGVEEAFQWLIDSVRAGKQGDVVFLFIAGHGLLDDQDNFFLATHDTDKERLRATAIDWRNVTRMLQEELLNSRRVVLLDTCHSGAIERSEAAGARDPLKMLDSPDMGTIFFASCNSKQSSLEDNDWGHGAFTLAILESLKESQLDQAPADGLFNPIELDLGIKKKVSILTSDRQQPVSFTPGNLQQTRILELR